mmetsp:Transcript_14137/g.40423  ORF Transcript_14137/g.40423 Transcript_14137/m.40423 type:complete len:227 (-) Transcript_14137:1354-2034(-)
MHPVLVHMPQNQADSKSLHRCVLWHRMAIGIVDARGEFDETPRLHGESRHDRHLLLELLRRLCGDILQRCYQEGPDLAKCKVVNAVLVLNITTKSAHTLVLVRGYIFLTRPVERCEGLIEETPLEQEEILHICSDLLNLHWHRFHLGIVLLNLAPHIQWKLALGVWQSKIDLGTAFDGKLVRATSHKVWPEGLKKLPCVLRELNWQKCTVKVLVQRRHGGGSLIAE